jgi:hypothetical protein
VTFEDWLVTQTATPQPRRRIVHLMLDRRLHEVDFGAHTIRAEVRRMLADFATATRGQWVRSCRSARRAPATARSPTVPETTSPTEAASDLVRAGPEAAWRRGVNSNLPSRRVLAPLLAGVGGWRGPQ